MTDTKHEQLLAQAALLAQTGSAKGRPPSANELRAWADKSLSPQRRAEVDSHLAHDPAILEQAMRYVGSSGATTRPAPPMLALAASALLALIGATYFLAAGSSTDVPVEAGVERSARATVSDWRGAAFESGVNHRDDFQPTALNIDACIDGSRCPQLASAVYNYGRTLTAIRATCARRGAPAASELAALEDTHKIFLDSFELAPWSEMLGRALAAPLDCSAVERLLQAPAGTP